MIDKEKRELKDGVISIFKRFNILDHTATIGGLRDDILRYIDSLQKEPVNVGTQIDYHNDAIKNLNSTLNSMEHNGHLPKMMTAAESLGISEEEYTKIEDELFEEQEEPVRGDFEMALAEMIDKAQKCVVEPWVVAAQWKDELLRLAKEKPVSEDLEKELPKVWDRETLDEYAYQVAYDLSNDWMRETPTWNDVETACKLGAEWKERQMIELGMSVSNKAQKGE